MILHGIFVGSNKRGRFQIHEIFMQKPSPNGDLRHREAETLIQVFFHVQLSQELEDSG